MNYFLIISFSANRQLSIDKELTEEEGWRKKLLALTGGKTVFLIFKFILTTKVPL